MLRLRRELKGEKQRNDLCYRISIVVRKGVSDNKETMNMECGDNDDDNSAAEAIAIMAEADRTAASTTAASAVDVTLTSSEIASQIVPSLTKIVVALQDVGVPKTNRDGQRKIKYDDLERMLNPIARKLLEMKLPYMNKNQTRIKQSLLLDTLAARKKQEKSQVALPIKAVLPETHQDSHMYIIDNDDVDTAGLLGVIINFINVKKKAGSSNINNNNNSNNNKTKIHADAVAAAAASAAARRKTRDKLEELAAAGLVAAAAKPRKRGYFLVTKSLTLDVADEICNLAIETANVNGFNPICICVMDSAGHIIVTKRMDGCPPMIYPKISHAKANTCVITKSSSRAYGAKYLIRPPPPPSNDNDDDDNHGGDDDEVGPSTFTRVINQISIAGGDMAAFQGGVLIKEKSTGVIVGSVGVSGAAEDEFCALEGVHKCSMARELTTVPEEHCCSTTTTQHDI